MGHLVPEEDWPYPPRSIGYFCNMLAEPPNPPSDDDEDYPSKRSEEVRQNAVRFLRNEIHHLWPQAVDASGEFRWEILADPSNEPPPEPGSSAGEARFDSQFWTANVNPTDRYVLALPGTLKYRISPLDITYDNLTIAGDWTDCGFNEGCVEAAVMSGRLAAHAITGLPALEEIIGYDHP